MSAKITSPKGKSPGTVSVEVPDRDHWQLDQEVPDGVFDSLETESLWDACCRDVPENLWQAWHKR